MSAIDPRVWDELRVSHLPGSPSRTIEAPTLFCPAFCESSSFFWLQCSTSPRCSICSMPGPGRWNPSIHFSYIHQVQPCFSTLPDLTSSRPPLGIPPRTRLGGDSWHRPQIPMIIHPLLSGQVLFPLPRPLPLRLLSQRQVLWASQYLTTKVSQW